MSTDDQADRTAALAAYTDDADNVAKPVTHPAAYAACDCLTGHQHTLAVRAAHSPTEPRWADGTFRAWREMFHDAMARAKKAEATVARVDTLFSGGPDTPCGTVYRRGIECVVVPMEDLREALDGPDE